MKAPFVPPYQHQDYPKWLYHATEPAKIVADATEHAALPPGWFEHPDEAKAAAAPPAPLALVAPLAPPVDTTGLSAEEAADLLKLQTELAELEAKEAADKAAAAAEPATEEEKQRQASHFGANVALVCARLKGASKEQLEDAQRLEATNPKGPRKGVMEFIEDAIAVAVATAARANDTQQ